MYICSVVGHFDSVFTKLLYFTIITATTDMLSISCQPCGWLCTQLRLSVCLFVINARKHDISETNLSLQNF